MMAFLGKVLIVSGLVIGVTGYFSHETNHLAFSGILILAAITLALREICEKLSNK